MIYIMRNFFMSILQDLDESARVDGCTQLQAFRKIGLPLALPGVAACSILTFLYSWREFLFSLIVTTDLTSMPISVAVYQFVGDVSVQWASLAAASVVAIIPTILVVVFFQRYIVRPDGRSTERMTERGESETMSESENRRPKRRLREVVSPAKTKTSTSR